MKLYRALFVNFISKYEKCTLVLVDKSDIHISIILTNTNIHTFMIKTF